MGDIYLPQVNIFAYGAPGPGDSPGSGFDLTATPGNYADTSTQGSHQSDVSWMLMAAPPGTGGTTGAATSAASPHGGQTPANNPGSAENFEAQIEAANQATAKREETAQLMMMLSTPTTYRSVSMSRDQFKGKVQEVLHRYPVPPPRPEMLMVDPDFIFNSAPLADQSVPMVPVIAHGPFYDYDWSIPALEPSNLPNTLLDPVIYGP